MKCFHATARDLAIGSVVTADRPTDYYPQVVPLLESVRPKGKPRRDVCLFACESIVGASTFASTQSPYRAFKVYEVEMPEFHRAPFRLNAELHQRIKAGKATSVLMEEYWKPADRWFFYELFGPSFIVISEVSASTYAEMYPFQISYEQRDVALSKTL